MIKFFVFLGKHRNNGAHSKNLQKFCDFFVVFDTLFEWHTSFFRSKIIQIVTLYVNAPRECVLDSPSKKIQKQRYMWWRFCVLFLFSVFYFLWNWVTGNIIVRGVKFLLKVDFCRSLLRVFKAPLVCCTHCFEKLSERNRQEE